MDGYPGRRFIGFRDRWVLFEEQVDLLVEGGLVLGKGEGNVKDR